MTTAKTGDKVKVHYTGTLKSGETFDSSRGREPLEFTIGEQRLIADFEKTVVGMAIGETRNVNISAVNAYGEIDKELIVTIPKNNVPPELNPQKGQHLQLNQPDGRIVPVVVVEVTDEGVVIDANHPLAGQDLTFAIELVEIL